MAVLLYYGYGDDSDGNDGVPVKASGKFTATRYNMGFKKPEICPLAWFL